MKNNKLFLTLLLGCLFSAVMLTENRAQNLTLTTQAQVNAFTYTAITGNLIIQESVSGNITNINALSSLTTVGGVFYIISNAALTNVNGLSSLTSVGGDLRIENNNALNNVDGLSGLTSLAGYLAINQNTALTNVDGLSSLTSVGGALSFFSNSALTNVNGLSSLTSVGGILSISSNAALTNVNGLSSLTSVGGDLRIENNNAQTNVNGLSSLTTVGGYLNVSHNPALTNVDGLSGITSIGGFLQIASNSSLTNVDGLSGIISGVGNLLISNNPALANVNGLSGITTVSGYLDIEWNTALTNVDGLSSLTSVGGYLFIGLNYSQTNVDGLSSLTTVGGYLTIKYTALTNVNGLSSLTFIGGLYLNIENNPSLTNVDGLSNLTTMTGQFLYIQNNTSLTDFCGLYALINGGGFSGNYFVSGNANNPTQQNIIDGGVCAPLPVELTAFSGKVIKNNVELSWQTATEVNNYGFEIERRRSELSSSSSSWNKIGFVPGNGNSNSPKYYSITDKNPNGASRFVYRLKQIDSDGKFEFSDEVEVELVPSEFALYQNYPNPFNPSTVIYYAIPTASNVRIEVFNVTGEKVATLVDGFRNVGNYDVVLNANGLSSGMYLYRITAGTFVQTKKMILLR